MASDVYAFACLAFELLTGELLFSAEDEMALVSLQIIHDGMPDKLRKLGTMSAATRLASLLGHCLRRDPRNRPTAAEVRRGLVDLGAELRAQTWPLASTAYSATA
jgi:serine/threonine protein kinase